MQRDSSDHSDHEPSVHERLTEPAPAIPQDYVLPHVRTTRPISMGDMEHEEYDNFNDPDFASKNRCSKYEPVTLEEDIIDDSFKLSRKPIPSYLANPGPLTRALAAIPDKAPDDKEDEEFENQSPPIDKDDKTDIVEWTPSTAEWLVMTTLSIISLMTALDACIIVTSLGTITKHLGGSTVQSFWVGTAYLLTCAVVMPFLASLSEIFGRMPCLFSSLVFFTMGTIICCRANEYETLLSGRVVQGIGGGGIIVLSQVIFTDIVPLRYRPKYFAVVQGAWAIGSCFGPVIGGALCQHTTWRWVFYIMFPFCGIGLIMIPLVVRMKLRERSTMKEKLSKVDWIGGFLFISSMTSFLIAISWGGIQEPWGSYHTIVPLVLGIVGIIATAIWERRFARYPFFKKSLWNKKSAAVGYACAAAQGLLLYAGLYYYPFYFESVHATTPIQTGLNLFPLTFALVPSTVLIGRLITRFGRYRWSLWIGWSLTTLGSGLTILFGRDIPTSHWVPSHVLLGLGHGFLLTTLNFMTQAIASAEDAGAAASMYVFSRSLGMAIGVAIGGSVFQNVMKIKLQQLGLDTEIAQEAERFVEVLWDATSTGMEGEMRGKVLEAYVYGFRGVYGFLTALAGVAGLVSLWGRHYDLDKGVGGGHELERRRGKGDGV